MFWSKIWFFLIAIAGAVALTVALILPRPAERQRLLEEEQRLTIACDVVNVLLGNNARDRIALAGKSARTQKIVDALAGVGGMATISPDKNRAARGEASKLLENIRGAKPDFVVLIDTQGRVVARHGIDDAGYGDTVAGYFLVDDALDGYLRDDLWVIDEKLYLTAGSPVIQRGIPDRWAGALILGHEMDKQRAEQIVSSLKGIHLGFYAGGRAIAATNAAPIHEDVLAARAAMNATDPDIGQDCRSNAPFTVTAGDKTYTALVARLPGEAGGRGAFFAVFSERPTALGFNGTLDQATGDDLSFANFPWIPLGGGLLVVLGIGLFLMLWEADRPLRKLAADAVKLAQSETDRLTEDRHSGRFGSIARSVNIHIDKIQREAKSAKKELNQLMGPEPAASSPSIGLPPTGLGGPAPASFRPPPPSEFKFNDKSGAGTPPPSIPVAAVDAPAARGAPAKPAVDSQVPPPPVSLPGTMRRGTPPPVPGLAPAAVPAESPPMRPSEPIMSIDDDILGDDEPPAKPRRGAPMFNDPTVTATPSQALIDASASAAMGEAIENAVGGLGPESNGDRDDGEDLEAELRRVFDAFVKLKKECGESTKSLTFEKFAKKLRANRDALIAKHNCRTVKFQVYTKAGKAALKATPIGKA